MVVQLPLPAQWARLESRRNPRDRLDQLHRDALDAKAEIRATLDRLPNGQARDLGRRRLSGLPDAQQGLASGPAAGVLI